jgi:hypothetical protein
MYRSIIKYSMIAALLVITGCAAPPAGSRVGGPSAAPESDAKSASVYVTNQPEEKGVESITLECRVAHQLGCRHKGRIYPWNAWVETKGYKASKYTIVDVVQTGNKATVTLIKK